MRLESIRQTVNLAVRSVYPDVRLLMERVENKAYCSLWSDNKEMLILASTEGAGDAYSPVYLEEFNKN